MDDDLVSVGYFFRFIGSQRELAECFKSSFPDISFEVRPYFKDRSKYNVVFEIIGGLDVPRVSAFIKNRIDFEKIDVFLEINSKTDNSIFEMPCHVLDVIRDLPVKVNVSFMYIGE